MIRLLIASRPLSWINTALPFLAVAIATGHGRTLAVALGTLYFLVPFNLLMYGVNDLFDFESDRNNPRKGGVEGALLPPEWAPRLWVAVALTNVPLLVLLIWLTGPLAAVALLITAASAVVYSAPPLRTKVVPGLDAVTSSLHFTLPALCGGLVAGAPLAELPWRFLAALFFWGVASQALGSMQDVAYDRAAGLRSIGTRLGQRGTAVFSTSGYALAVLIVASAGGPALIAAAALLTYVALAASCLGGNPLQARRAWRGFLGLNLLCGFVITQVLLHVWGLGTRDVLLLLAAAVATLAWGSFWLAVANLLATRPTASDRAGLPSAQPLGGTSGGVLVVVPGPGGGPALGTALEGASALYSLVFQPHLLQRLTGGRLVPWSALPGALIRPTSGPWRAVDGARIEPGPSVPAAGWWQRWRADYAVHCGHGLGVELGYALSVAAILLGPPLLTVVALAARDRAAAVAGIVGCVAVILLRLLVALVRRERPSTLLLHPVAVAAVLGAQLCSIADSLAGRDLPQSTPRPAGPAAAPTP